MPATEKEIRSAIDKGRETGKLNEHEIKLIEEWIYGPGSHGTGFYHKLVGLIFKADRENKQKIRMGFPFEVDAVMAYYDGSLKKRCNELGLDF